MMIFVLMALLACLVPGLAGKVGKNGERRESDTRAPGNHRHQSRRNSYERQSSYSRHASNAQKLVLDIRTSSRDESRRRRRKHRRSPSSSSSSSSSSGDAELRRKLRRARKELDEFKQQAADRAANEKLAQDKLEAERQRLAAESARRAEMDEFQNRILQMLPAQISGGTQKVAPRGKQHEESQFEPKDAKLATLEVHEVTDLRGCMSWSEVDAKLSTVPVAALRDVLIRKGQKAPTTKRAAVNALMAILRDSFGSNVKQ
eukprot:TRINITY_DN80755_c0_g1_i1.p1 TRINITY_DN80755_c0_g1~~TRINITY_DN80755_c0_g1_i1.p1  ORF type:complete len:260 (+),score=54.72 TRINITY_DN80755_c0_g1_i1:212-991(+)